MAEYRHCLLVVTAALSQVKSPYPPAVNPNQITQSLIAVLAGLRVPLRAFLEVERNEGQSATVIRRNVGSAHGRGRADSHRSGQQPV
jgi:hypothetical protein